ncbi:MAG TPA: helix-turn-helix domain-containing protein [Acidimicrobiales bacterium]|nr:helix-turn-helix domain-containing protein [Acidimicrobiales bacterium]
MTISSSGPVTDTSIWGEEEAMVIPMPRRDAEADDLPVVLSVEEAAAFLRIGRTSAYELARRYEATGGREGLPVVRLGRLLRVPRAGLLRLLELPDPAA